MEVLSANDHICFLHMACLYGAGIGIYVFQTVAQTACLLQQYMLTSQAVWVILGAVAMNSLQESQDVDVVY